MALTIGSRVVRTVHDGSDGETEGHAELGTGGSGYKSALRSVNGCYAVGMCSGNNPFLPRVARPCVHLLLRSSYCVGFLSDARDLVGKILAKPAKSPPTGILAILKLRPVTFAPSLFLCPITPLLVPSNVSLFHPGAIRAV